MVPKNQSMKGFSLQFNTYPRSQLGNFSYNICMLSTPNGLNYLMSICILQFDLFQVKLPLQYVVMKRLINRIDVGACLNLPHNSINSF